ncbi:alpha-N-acetylglucosaminidase C-terminal domain-containing protein [Sphingobacterium sp. 18053]|uniref:alpha-N-acetylglucosaminidase C-terminal domain-containing protein n=1 Tax=Sphingobacterium sp. 18053 TaxID=2681401 RepID=UPI00135B191E|nr:alpha-N-acetylglucosaminidase C-terminal domain-containing protein [Sphingobacterium sp. 18053]
MLSLGLTVNATLVDWGSLLKDCAHKEWGGLLGSLYYQRWKLFIDESLKGNIVPAEVFYTIEVAWAKETDPFPLIKLKKEKIDKIQDYILQ